MVDVRRSTTRSRSWSAWAGTREELLKIGTELERLYAQRREAILAEYDRETDSIVKELKDSGDERLAEIRRERRLGDRADYEGRWHLSLTLTDGVEDATGSVSDVFPEFDRRTHTKVTFVGSIDMIGKSEPDYLKVEFRKLHQEAVFLHVRSTDPGWARQVVSKMSDEIGAGAPWWAFLYRPWGRGLLQGVSWFLIYYSLYLLFSPIFAANKASVSRQVWGLLAIFGATLVLTYSANNKRSLNWMLPNFEVTDGGQSTGTRFLFFVAGLALAFISGIIVNRVS
ncbi:hypothetical protein ACWEH1_10575 [Micromonospora chersina]